MLARARARVAVLLGCGVPGNYNAKLCSLAALMLPTNVATWKRTLLRTDTTFGDNYDDE